MARPKGPEQRVPVKMRVNIGLMDRLRQLAGENRYSVPKMLPVAKFVVGTSLGNRAVIVTLVIAAAPYVARMVESAAKEVNVKMEKKTRRAPCSGAPRVVRIHDSLYSNPRRSR